MGAKKQNAEYSQMYEQFRSIDKKSLSSVKSAEFMTELLPKGLYKNSEIAEIGVAAVLVAKIAHQCTLEEFEEFMRTEETPPLKMTKEEMAVLKGGKINWGKIAAIGVGVLAVGGAAFVALRGRGGGQQPGLPTAPSPGPGRIIPTENGAYQPNGQWVRTPLIPQRDQLDTPQMRANMSQLLKAR